MTERKRKPAPSRRVKTTAPPPPDRQEAAERLARLKASCIAGLNNLDTFDRTLRETHQTLLLQAAEVGRCLREIRDSGVYLLQSKTFEEFVRVQLKRSRFRAYQLINTANLVDALLTVVNKLTSERQIRPLTALLPPGRVLEAFERAAALAGDRPPTGAEIKREVDAMLGRQPARKPKTKPEPGPVDATKRVEDLATRLARIDTGRVNDPYVLAWLAKQLADRIGEPGDREGGRFTAGWEGNEPEAVITSFATLIPQLPWVVAHIKKETTAAGHDDTPAGDVGNPPPIEPETEGGPAGTPEATTLGGWQLVFSEVRFPNPVLAGKALRGHRFKSLFPNLADYVQALAKELAVATRNFTPAHYRGGARALRKISALLPEMIDFLDRKATDPPAGDVDHIA
jgi:hypothetical protein